MKYGNPTIWAISLCLVTPIALEDGTLIYNALSQSVRFIVAKNEEGKLSFGSGVLIEGAGRHVLTCYHVIKDAKQIAIFSPDATPEFKGFIVEPKHYLEKINDTYKFAEVIKVDPKRDLALLKEPKGEFPYYVQGIAIATDSADVGQTLYTIGNSGVRDEVLWRFGSGQARASYKKTFNISLSQTVSARILEMSMPLDLERLTLA